MFDFIYFTECIIEFSYPISPALKRSCKALVAPWSVKQEKNINSSNSVYSVFDSNMVKCKQN